jgi:hypothetical protein
MILEVCQLILISFVTAYTMDMSDPTSAIQLSPTSHMDRHKQMSDSNPAEVAKDEKGSLLTLMSEEIGNVLKLCQ